ncbi:MAG TPA: TetR/AcrR family transcriptional regulator [Solirubrobacterales bacterium]|nr:TetR/AcrR family transcriptional regulator [Solirubrobacterales bacterium]
MIEIAGGEGYESVTVRELVNLAGVSTRAFYLHFRDKEDCFLRTYELVVQRTTTRIVAAQNGERGWLERMRRAFEAFANEIAREPRSARLALVEPYAVGPTALEMVRRTDCLFEAMVAESLARAPEPFEIPPLVIKGMVAGVSRVARARLLSGRAGDMPGLARQLQRWVLSFNDPAAGRLKGLDPRPNERRPLSPEATLPFMGQSLREDDRTLILTAVAKLVASEGYSQLTIPRIRTAAGVSRRNFNTYFEGVEDCFLAALERRATTAIRAAAEHEYASGDDWARRVDTTVSRLCARIIGDPLLSRLAFVDAFAPGIAGLRCRENITTSLAKSFDAGAPPCLGSEEVASEASIGAIWAILHHYAVTGRTAELPRIAPTLSYLALAPAIGAPAAEETIRDGQERH